MKKRDRRRGAEGQSIRKDGREIINANASQKPDRLELSEVTAVFWRVLIVIHDAVGLGRNWGCLFLKCWIRQGIIDHRCWGNLQPHTYCAFL